jgi:hypothetical protein
MMPPEIVWESDPLYAELETLARVGSFQHPRILGWEYRKGHENAGPLYRRIGYVGAVLQSPLDTVYGATSAVPGTPGVPRMEPAVAPVYFLTAQQIEAMGAVGEAMLADGVAGVHAARTRD